MGNSSHAGSSGWSTGEGESHSLDTFEGTEGDSNVPRGAGLGNLAAFGIASGMSRRLQKGVDYTPKPTVTSDEDVNEDEVDEMDGEIVNEQNRSTNNIFPGSPIVFPTLPEEPPSSPISSIDAAIEAGDWAAVG